MYNQEQFKSAVKLLEEKGLSTGDVLKVRKAFGEWGKWMLDDVKQGKYGYQSELPGIENCTFDTDAEVKLFNALHIYAPVIEKDKLIKIFEIVTKLTDTSKDVEVISLSTKIK